VLTTATPAAATRRVLPGVLVAAYSHIAVAELVLDGTPPRDAFTWAWRLHYEYLMPRAWEAWGWREAPLAYQLRTAHPDSMTQDGPYWMLPIPAGKRWTHGCYALSAAQNRGRLLRDDPAGIALPAAAADRLAWLLETMRRYATGGGDLTACARGAADQAAGRPRRRRAPASPAWLTAEAAEALTGLWDVLRRDAARAGAARLWPGTRPGP
jgi:hypothetical protein